MKRRWVSLLVLMLVLGVMAKAQTPGTPAPPAPEKPAAGAEVPVEIKLPQQIKLPSSPGYFVVRAEVTAGGRRFPLYFGLFLPAAYFQQHEPFPVVVSLHNVGYGERSGKSVEEEGLASLWARDGWDARLIPEHDYTPEGIPVPEGAVNLRKEGRFVGVAPACPQHRPAAEGVMPRVISALVSQLGKMYRLDDDRVYLTGFSYGGTSTWRIAEQMPDRFAAIAPLSSRATVDPEKTAQTLKDLPIYVACGTDEWSKEPCEQMHEAFVKSGHPQFVFREIEGGTHWCYPKVYGDPAFWDWLLSKRRHGASAAGATTKAVTP